MKVINETLFFRFNFIALLILFSVGCATTNKSSTVTADDDGKIGTQEAEVIVQKVFDRLDCENKGIIDTGEVDEHFGQIWLPADRDRSHSLSRSEYSLVHGSKSPAVAQLLFKDADANADEQIDMNEFRTQLQHMIKMLDANGDYEVTREEVGLQPLAPPKRRTNLSKKPSQYER